MLSTHTQKNTYSIIFLTVISNCRNVINVYIREKLVKLHAFNTCKKSSGIWYGIYNLVMY